MCVPAKILLILQKSLALALCQKIDIPRFPPCIGSFCCVVEALEAMEKLFSSVALGVKGVP